MDFFRGLLHLLSFNFTGFADVLNQSPIIITWLVFLIFCLCAILFLLKFFGEAGMYIYTVVAVIGTNIQVLKIVDFNTVIFTFIFGTYILRIVIAILDTPFIYLAKYFVPNRIND